MSNISLFQYMSFEKCFSILRNNGLPLRNFISYNDPFECLPEFVEYAAIQALCRPSKEEDRKKVILDYLRSLSSKYSFNDDFIIGIANGIVSTGLLKYPRISLIGAYVVIAGVTYLYARARNDDPKKIDIGLELFYSKYFPLLVNSYTSCFTLGMNNLLMWSHYAQSHCGVVMEFDPDKIPFSNGILRRINYNEKRFDFAVANIHDETTVRDSAYSLISTKSRLWQYENEVRLIYDIKSNQNEIIWRDNFNNPVVKLDITSIKKIYIGRRASVNDVDTLYSILMEYGLEKQIDVIKVRLSRTGYLIEAD